MANDKQARPLRKERKAAKKAAWKAKTPGQRWKHRGLVLIRIILIIVVILVLLWTAMKVSYCTGAKEVAGPAASATTRDAQVMESVSSSGIAAYDTLFDYDGLYMSTEAFGWAQMGEQDFSSQDTANSGYSGTDLPQIFNAYCMTCHSSTALESYSASADVARAKMESMRDDYNCPDLTDEQIDILTEYYTEK